MMKRSPALFLFAIGLCLTTATLDSRSQERRPLRWTSTPVGSHGYRVGLAFAGVARQVLGSDYNVSVAPYTTPAVSMKAAMAGEGEIAFTADISMSEFRDRTGNFRDYHPQRSPLAHTWYAYSVQSMMAVAARNADRFKCWRDFSGQPVFFTPINFMNWSNFQRVFKILHYDFNDVPVAPRANAGALEAGTVVGSVVFTTAGQELSTYWKETVLKTDVRVVNPCPDEMAKLEAAGLVIEDVDSKVAFGKDVGPKTLKGVSILFGYDARLDVSEDIVYRLTHAFYERRNELAKMEPTLGVMASDFVGLQVRGIRANPTVAVHPGMAKFLKEQGRWDNAWTVGTTGN